jgi:hypothetical protein
MLTCEQLLAENAALRAENADLKRRLGAAIVRIAKLEGRLAHELQELLGAFAGVLVSDRWPASMLRKEVRPCRERLQLHRAGAESRPQRGRACDNVAGCAEVSSR